MCQFFINRYRQQNPTWEQASCLAFEDADISKLHRSLAEYKKTPLVNLPELAKSIGVKQLIIKDE